MLWFANAVTGLRRVGEGGGGEPPEDEDWMKTTVTVSAAQLRELNSNPVTLVAAPGAGNVIVPKGIHFSFRAGAAGFEPGPSLPQVFFAASIVEITGTGSGFEGTTPFVFQDNLTLFNNKASTDDIENLPVTLGADGDWTPAVGDGTAYVVFYYDIELV